MAKMQGRLYLRRVFIQGALIGLFLVFSLRSLSFWFNHVPPGERNPKETVPTTSNGQKERPKLLAFVGVQVDVDSNESIGTKCGACSQGSVDHERRCNIAMNYVGSF